VADDVAVEVPMAFVASTVTLSVDHTSALTGTYDALVAPAIGVHDAPAASQRTHW
jgi:hypothetical protein